MKRFLIFPALCLAPLFSFGQAITLNASDMPLPGTFNLQDLSAFTTPPAPAISAPGLWDYSGYWDNAILSNIYATETDTFFTAAGVTINNPTFRLLGTLINYNIVSELVSNASGVAETGVHIAAQGFNLSGCTLTPTDSLLFPVQSAVYSTQKTLMQYPCTMGTHWSSTSRRTSNFVLTIHTDSLNHAAGTHVYAVHRTDSIVGWGSMKVHATTGPSMAYPVLVDKITEYSEDSLYVNGAPADSTVLATFGLVQGQRTGKANQYYFLRSGSFNYLMSFFYGDDSTFTHPIEVYVDTDNLEPAPTGVAIAENQSADVVIFPNPATPGNVVHLVYSGLPGTPAGFVISDINGKEILNARFNHPARNQTIPLPHNLTPGTYHITIADDQSNMLWNGKIEVR